mgnify:CR=1 FL=1
MYEICQAQSENLEQVLNGQLVPEEEIIVDDVTTLRNIESEHNYAVYHDDQVPECSYEHKEEQQMTNSERIEEEQGIPMGILLEEETTNENGRFERSKQRSKKKKGSKNKKSSKRNYSQNHE